MKKLLISAALCALFAAPGFAGEPVKLSSAQMDKVTAGDFCRVCIQRNFTRQDADATAVAITGFAGVLSGNATAVASNSNETRQRIN
jgi:hypothetical protein